MDTHTIDATNKRLGRLASEISVILMGKHLPDFVRNKPGTATVVITNALMLDIPPKKLKEKMYVRYSGYPRGLKERSMEKVIGKFEIKTVIEKAVYRMLPPNRLRRNRMQRLVIKETV